ncbi:MAG TPA: S9 family peptidase [Longimicrobiaceae bacterium]|nr:S9 family peptidase [Longimicrobiaceae bacterium]
MNKRLSLHYSVIATVVLLAGPAGAQEKSRFSSVEEALGASALLAGESGPASVNWIESGERFSYTTINPASGQEEIRVYDPKELQDQVLFDTNDLTLPGTGEPIEYRSFQWASDSEHILLQADFRPIYRSSGIADFFLFSPATDEMELVADDARTAELSPDGDLVAYERGGDLYVFDMAADAERRLTTTGSDTLFNGVFDWVYEEEFGLTQAWKWSPDSRRIAFWQTEEAGVPAVQLTDYSGQHPEWISINYPKVGDENPEVRIGVADVQTGDIVWLETGLSGDFYIPRIYWTADPNTLAVMTLNRAQNHLRVFFFDVATGERRLVLEEESDAWIDVFDFYAGIQDFLYFPDDIREFFWISDRDGNQHIYRYGYDGELINQVTEGDWVVTRVEAIEPVSQTIYYTSTEASPLDRNLYAIQFDGSGKRRLTQTPGRHSVNVSPDGEWYIDSWSNTGTPRQVELWSTDGERVAVLEDNAETSEWLELHAYSPLDLFQFTTSDGVNLDGSMILPPDFDPEVEYPVLLSIYGGPGSQQVYNAFATNGWHQYLAQQGYIVVGLNNRGTGNYGRDFVEIVYKQLGKWESHDFAEVAKYLATLPYVDEDAIAIQGTSYGGYMAVYTLLQYPELFAFGISNSPVTDWRLYDSIYTERYMGLLSANLAGYEASSTLPYAEALEDPLLLVHSAMDENVHPQNTMQLLTALTNAGKDVDLRFYPPGAHGAAYNAQSYITMTEVYTNALCEQLKEGCVPVDLNR